MTSEFRVMPGHLYVVATPIGNLGDFSDRAKEVLSGVDFICAEDTRHSQILLNSINVKSECIRYDEHVHDQVFELILTRLLGGESAALVSDAGAPGVSDPGQFLVEKLRTRGVPVTPIPGASALTTLVSVAGFFPLKSFTFRGFFPRKLGEQTLEIEILNLVAQHEAIFYFESPNRIEESLAFLRDHLRRDAVLVVGKELTKKFETILSLKLSDYNALEDIRGEWTFGVFFNDVPLHKSQEFVKIEGLLKSFRDLNVSMKDAVKHLSEHFLDHRNAIYKLALKIYEK